MLRRNVLIFHAGALGDFILSWPLAMAVGRLYPQSRIIYVTSSGKGALAEKVLRVESTDVEQGWHQLYSNPDGLSESCRRRLEGAHAIFSFVASPGDDWAKSVGGISPQAEITFLKTRPPGDFRGHASEYLLHGLAQRPVVRTAVAQMLASIASSGVSISRPKGEHIVIHPGSGSAEKCWPVDSYLQLIERLRRDEKPVKIVVGEVECDSQARPGQSLDRLAAVAPIVKCESYLALLDELRKARVFIGNDSGPGHLAGIIGVPTISLFGPTNPAVWKPLGPCVTALAATPASALTVDAVYDSICLNQ